MPAPFRRESNRGRSHCSRPLYLSAERVLCPPNCNRGSADSAFCWLEERSPRCFAQTQNMRSTEFAIKERDVRCPEFLRFWAPVSNPARDLRKHIPARFPVQQILRAADGKLLPGL